MASLTKELASAIASSKNADDQARSQIEDAQSQFATRQSAITQELTLAKKDLYTLQIERDRLTVQVSNLTAERDRLSLDNSDRDVDRDQLV